LEHSGLFSLADKVAVITGAGAGLGVEIALAYAGAGADIVCVDINFDAARRTADAVEAIGQRGLPLRCDVTIEDEVRSTIQEAHGHFGRIDILVNNAGIADPDPSPVGNYKSSGWHQVIDVDLHGLFYCCNETLPYMEKQGSGKIVNIASIWGMVGGANAVPIPAYSAAKGAVINLTREIGLEFATKNIQVNALCPGFHQGTQLGGGVTANADFAALLTNLTPMGRLADAAEIRGPALFLASPASNFMTGQTLVTDGGALAQ
jgi:NAD(P)-dependent dehydrogenase (short-subunit alcohol dehydrogenase family)